MFLTFIEFATIIASLILWAKLLNNKLSIKSTDVFGQKIVFFLEFRRGKTDLRVRKDDFDAVFFSQRLSNSPCRGVV